ncbi:hypothetical protein SDC9_162230 [bioreactor metagenome]|uniref:Uncharacterized protein n=1 Tax=bioreactor metagenome TaxID=1076179 RepID=A0A645FKI9_9ZZZZ
MIPAVIKIDGVRIIEIVYGISVKSIPLKAEPAKYSFLLTGIAPKKSELFFDLSKANTI